MFGILLASIGALLEELSSSIAKAEVKRKVESIYAMGFLNAIWGVLFFALLVVWRGESVMAFAAWPTFILRAGLSIFQAYLTVHAIAKADRSTFGFIRTGTIPLLLFVDVAILGSVISRFQLTGMALICIGMLFLYFNHGFSKKGMGYLIASVFNSALTIGLYKYNITHGNSVELEILFSLLILMGFFYLMCRLTSREEPFTLLKKPLIAMQSGTIGVAAVVESFAYVFAPASVILAATRSSTVIFTVLSGGMYFHEKRIPVKIISLTAFVGGIALLALG